MKNQIKKSGQLGVTMIELMIAVAVLGLLSLVFSKLVMAGLQSWKNNFNQTMMLRRANTARDTMKYELRNASASTFFVSRTNTTEPFFSSVTFLDTMGNTRQFYKQTDRLIFYTNEKGRERRDALLVLSDRGRMQFESLRFFYPDEKDFSVINFSFSILKNKEDKMQRQDIRHVVSGSVELRNP
jgi:prepilin-type N-terminal cleavage/methylation domain-containing protein